MRLPWRDSIATLFVVVALGLYLAWALDRELPGFGTVRVVTVAVLGLGVVASASAVVPGFGELMHGSRFYLTVSSGIGVLAVAAGLFALLAEEAVALLVLVLATITLWAMATVRHAAVKRPPERLEHR